MRTTRSTGSMGHLPVVALLLLLLYRAWAQGASCAAGSGTCVGAAQICAIGELTASNDDCGPVGTVRCCEVAQAPITLGVDPLAAGLPGNRFDCAPAGLTCADIGALDLLPTFSEVAPCAGGLATCLIPLTACAAPTAEGGVSGFCTDSPCGSFPGGVQAGSGFDLCNGGEHAFCCVTADPFACDDGLACTIETLTVGGTCLNTALNDHFCGDVCSGDNVQPRSLQEQGGQCVCANALSLDICPAAASACEQRACVIDDFSNDAQCTTVPSLACPSECDGAVINHFAPVDQGGVCTCVPDTATACFGLGDVCALDACVLNPLTGEPECGTVPKCDDGNACTVDSCDAVSGACSTAPVVLPCDDGDPCTRDELVDVGGTCTCVSTAPVTCGAGEFCSQGACYADVVVDVPTFLVPSTQVTGAGSGTSVAIIDAGIESFLIQQPGTPELYTEFSLQIDSAIEVDTDGILMVEYELSTPLQVGSVSVLDPADQPSTVTYVTSVDDAINNQQCTTVNSYDPGTGLVTTDTVCLELDGSGDFAPITTATSTDISNCLSPEFQACAQASVLVDLCATQRAADCSCGAKKRSANPTTALLSALALRFGAADGTELLVSNLSFTNAAVALQPPAPAPTPTPTPTPTPEPTPTPSGPTGCTHGQGYWRHQVREDRVAASTLASLELCGLSVEEQFAMRPKKGNAWVILDHQLLAAELNRAAGASVPLEIVSAIDAARLLLAETCTSITPKGANKGYRREAIELASLLAEYNEGAAGPGSCDGQGHQVEFHTQRGAAARYYASMRTGAARARMRRSTGAEPTPEELEAEERDILNAMYDSRDYEPGWNDWAFAEDERTALPGNQLSGLGIAAVAVSCTVFLIVAVGTVILGVRRVILSRARYNPMPDGSDAMYEDDEFSLSDVELSTLVHTSDDELNEADDAMDMSAI